MSELLKIKLNGEETETAARTVAELLRETQAPEIGVAVARNGAVVRRAEQQSTPLAEGDDIEIIRAVQGG
jgi:sulfur carrier protein